MLGKGAAIATTDADLVKVAESKNVHPADLEAIAKVESRGFGWSIDGRIKILFEKHKFYKYCPKKLRSEAVKRGVGRANWISPANGGYKDQSTTDARYRFLATAIEIDERAAYMSISIGTYQIMGFNYAICGFGSAREMFAAFVTSEAHQLAAFAKFLEGNGLDDPIRRGDFETVEKVYNGGGLNGEYAREMRAQSQALRAGKWADYVPGAKVINIPNMPNQLPDEPAHQKPKTISEIIAQIVSAIIKFLSKENRT